MKTCTKMKTEDPVMCCGQIKIRSPKQGMIKYELKNFMEHVVCFQKKIFLA